MGETDQLAEWIINCRIAHFGKDATKLSGSILTKVSMRTRGKDPTTSKR